MKSHRVAGRPLLPSRCFTLRASGNDRPGLTRRQSRSRLRGSYEEVGRESHSLLASLFLSRDGTLATWQRSPPLERQLRFDYFRWRRRRRWLAIGGRWPPMIAERFHLFSGGIAASRSRTIAAQRRAPGGRRGVGCRASGGNLHSTLPTAAVGSVARRPRNAIVPEVRSRSQSASQSPRVAAQRG